MAIFSPLLLLVAVSFGLTSFSVSAADVLPLRVSALDGTAAYQLPDDVDWQELDRNQPLYTQDRVYTHSGSRLELELPRGNFVRLDGNTEVRIDALSQGAVDLILDHGHLIVRIRRSFPVAIHTVRGTIDMEEPGLYRLGIDQSLATVSVRKGSVSVHQQSGDTIHLHRGEALEMPSSGPEVRTTASVNPQDDFDLWSDRRDAYQVTSKSRPYLGAGDYAGAYDLDHYGSWSHVSGYGRVWSPNVAIGWVPYRHGYFSHYPRWGWTWISYEPWGWLPYHYGSWDYHNAHRRWYWVPGHLNRFHGARVHFFHNNTHVAWAPFSRFSLGFGNGGFGFSFQSGSGFFPRGHHGVTFIDRTHFGHPYSVHSHHIRNNRQHLGRGIRPGAIAPLEPSRRQLRVARGPGRVSTTGGTVGRRFGANRSANTFSRIDASRNSRSSPVSTLNSRSRARTGSAPSGLIQGTRPQPRSPVREIFNRSAQNRLRSSGRDARTSTFRAPASPSGSTGSSAVRRSESRFRGTISSRPTNSFLGRPRVERTPRQSRPSSKQTFRGQSSRATRSLSRSTRSRDSVRKAGPSRRPTGRSQARPSSRSRAGGRPN